MLFRSNYYCLQINQSNQSINQAVMHFSGKRSEKNDKLILKGETCLTYAINNAITMTNWRKTDMDYRWKNGMYPTTVSQIYLLPNYRVKFYNTICVIVLKLGNKAVNDLYFRLKPNAYSPSSLKRTTFIFMITLPDLNRFLTARQHSLLCRALS